MKRLSLMLAVFLGCYLSAFLVTSSLAQAKAPAGGGAAVAEAPADAGIEGEPTSKKGHSEEVSLWVVITRAGWFGALIWLLLIACLIICVTLVVDSYLTIRESRISPITLVESVRGAIEQGDLFKAMEFCEHTPGPLSNILTAGFSNAAEGFEVVQDAVGVAADIESEKLLSRVTYLSVISNTTPMLGLIGTVQGMIMAFFNIGTAEAGAAQTAMLAVNISHGLWATAVGLGTAVPATIWFYYFKNKATRIILGMEALTLEVTKTLRNVEVVQE